MKPWLWTMVWALGWGAVVPLGADPVLVNTLDTKALVSLRTDRGVVTRDLIAGERLAIAAQTLSGVGEKDVALGSGVVFLARFGALPRFYRLAANQVLIVNQTPAALSVTLAGRVSGVLARGAPALGELEGGRLEVQWTDGQQTITEPGLYRFVLESGTVLRPWGD